MPPLAISRSVSNHVERFFVLGARVIAQQEMVDRGPRKLGRAAEAAELRVEGAAEDWKAAVEHSGVDACRAGGGAHGHLLPATAPPLRARSDNLRRSLLPGVGDSAPAPPGNQDGRSDFPAGNTCRRKTAAGRESARPTWASRRPGGRLHEGHVDAIDVGPLFAIHFDGHEISIQKSGDLLVLELSRSITWHQWHVE